MGAIIVLVVFWAETVRLWTLDGPKFPLIFLALCLAGAALSYLFDT